MGEGGVPLIMSPPLAWSHISQELRVPELVSWYERLASTRTLIRYDPRNEGLSDRGVERVSEADLASDIEALIERLGQSQVDLLGFYGSGSPMLRVAAEHQSVRKLVVWNISVNGPGIFANPRWRAMRGLVDTDWVLFTETFAGAAFGWSGDEPHKWARFTRRAVGPEDAALMMDALGRIDWSQWLARIHVPTLVLRDPRNISLVEGKWADILDARLVDLRARASAYRNETGQRAVEEFLSNGEQTPVVTAPSHETASGTAIILFADIADSTALTERLGDAAFRDKARELDEALRRAIASNGGTAIEGKLLGDGVLATFGAAREAIACAQEIHQIARTQSSPPRVGEGLGEGSALLLHIGIHAGDVIREANNVYGGAVNIASRVASEAAVGETLVSATVRDLARTSAGVSFEDRGERELKGVAEAVRLWAVRAGR